MGSKGPNFVAAANRFLFPLLMSVVVHVRPKKYFVTLSLRNRVVARHQHVFLSLELGLLVRVLDEQSSSPGFDS